MLIGSTNISKYNAVQHTVTFEHNSISNESEWTAGAVVPFFDRNHVGMKEWTVTLLVKGSSREAIISNCSNLLSLLTDTADLTLDGFTHKFKGILKEHSRTETVMRRYHTLTLTFEGYEHGSVVSTSGKSSITLSNPGNLTSPCVVEITPSVGASSITLTGVCRDSSTGEDLPVTIANLVSGKTVTLDGLTGLITQAGVQKGGDVSIWALPSMKPGSNTVTVNNTNMTVAVKTTPLYL